MMTNSTEEKSGSLVILVIEDDPQIRRFLRAILTSNGYRFLEAADAQEGIRQASLQHPDLIILDLGLPDMDGLEVTRQLREWSKPPSSSYQRVTRKKTKFWFWMQVRMII
jgi:CheY-like chemotaxis protein